jgi:hypothetical protein
MFRNARTNGRRGRIRMDIKWTVKAAELWVPPSPYVLFGTMQVWSETLSYHIKDKGDIEDGKATILLCVCACECACNERERERDYKFP